LLHRELLLLLRLLPRLAMGRQVTFLQAALLYMVDPLMKKSSLQAYSSSTHG
jgi:hypothetical protein